MILAAILTGLAVLLGGVAVIVSIREKKTVTSILHEGQDKDVIDVVLDKKRKKLSANPWGMSLKTYAMLAGGGTVALGVAGYIASANYLIAIPCALVGFFTPELVEMFRNSRERAKFEERYARALRQISASIKSGLSVRQAVHEICVNPFIHDSIRDEFRQLDSDLQVGLSIQEGFERFANRVNSDDATDVAIAITLQNQIGGNSSILIETITRDINNRISNRRETKSLFAGSSSTIKMMDIVPFATIAFFAVSSPQYVAPFFETFFMQCVFWGLLGFMAIGSVVVRNVVRNMRKSCDI